MKKKKKNLNDGAIPRPPAQFILLSDRHSYHKYLYIYFFLLEYYRDEFVFV